MGGRGGIDQTCLFHFIWIILIISCLFSCSLLLFVDEADAFLRKRSTVSLDCSDFCHLMCFTFLKIRWTSPFHPLASCLLFISWHIRRPNRLTQMWANFCTIVQNAIIHWWAKSFVDDETKVLIVQLIKFSYSRSF